MPLPPLRLPMPRPLPTLPPPKLLQRLLLTQPLKHRPMPLLPRLPMQMPLR